MRGWGRESAGTWEPAAPSKHDVMVKTALTGLAALALAATACTRTTVEAPSPAPPERSLVVTGVGRVEVRPDTLVVSLGVSSERPTAPEALAAVSAGARAMLQAMRGEGVAERDVRTTSLTVRPSRDDQGRIVGFVGTEMFRVRVRDLERAGAIVGAAVEAVGDDARVAGMSLEVADPDAAMQAARKRAVEDAQRRAQELAETAGIRLGAPTSIEEGRAGRPRAIRLPAAADVEAFTEAAALAPRIEPGTQEVTVRVLVRFEIAS